MAELYDQNKIYANRPQASSQAPQSADAELEAMLAELPPEEREAARASITAAPTGEDINRAMQERNANGEVFNMNIDQYRLWKSNNKTKEVDVLDTMGQAAEGVFNEIMAAAGSIYDKPLESTAKLTPSLVEAFAQGTRSLYGMAAQSQDPNSAFFRVKNAITANGDDEQAEFQQFMDAQAFNVHSMRLATGKDTIVMDKDIINPEMTQVMSYIADPTLFIPFGGIAAKGAKMVGMAEGLAKASARASQIQRKVLGGAIKWGVGAPIEFLGTATRNTIDYGLERAGTVFEVATGMPMAEAQATAKMYGLQTASAALEGRTVGLPVFGDIAGAAVGSTTARGVGEALTMVGEQMQKQQQFGRGILSYAGQALRDANKSGVPLSKHAKALLNVLDKVDPLFVYSADISKGAAEGMVIGAGLGYLSAGEEGAASGAGAGMALGAAGAGMGSVVSDIGNGRLYDRIAVQRQMVIEGLRQIDPQKAAAFEALVKTAEINGNRDIIAQVDGIITGIDVMAPDAKVVARDEVGHKAWLLSQRIDPKTGRLMEPLALFPEFGTDRKSRAKSLSFLSMLGNRFDGDHKLLISELQKLPQDHALRKQFLRLSGEQKKAVFDALDKAATPEFKEIFGGKNGYEFYGDLNYSEANVARVNAAFDAGNKTQANEMIRQFLKNETGKDGKLTARGELLKQKLATEGYFDKDGNMRPSRLKDIETTQRNFENAKGFVFRRDSTGQVELHINLNQFGKETLPHELFHAVMMDSVLKPDFIDRLSQNLLGKFDADGKRIENASVDIKQVRQFFQRYIDALHGKNSPDAKNETARLEAAMKEYESRGTTNKIALETKNTLEGLLEEFGAYYFGAFINDKPVDFLFRGGELGAMREIMWNAKQGFLDFWRSKIKGINPDFNFDPATNEYIFQAFEKEGVRTKNKSLDLLMRDFVRATAMANKQGGFDVSRLSHAARETFVKNNGIRGLSMTRDANGNLVRSPQRKVMIEQMRVGKEIYKILSGLDPKFRQGLITDGEGNLSGRLSPEAMEAMVQSGHIDRAWVDKIQQAYNILDGKGGNVIHFGYLGRTAQIGDYAWPRLVGSDVPFKNRQAVLLGVDFKVGKDGKMYSLFHTLDKAVIDGRADVLWSDSAVRTLWNGDRGAMEADFFRYLANASKAAGDSSRVESAILLEDGTGAGGRRRDVLHQMLGIVKAEGDVYLNKPIAEIPYGIRHSVTTFNVDGIANMRVGTDRWNVVPENAYKDLSRNFQPSEMAREDTPNGSIIKHSLGYKFAEKNGKVRAFDDQGNSIGVFDGIQQAADAAGKHSVKQKQELIKATNEQTTEQFNQGRKFQVLERNERDEAVRLGDVYQVPKVDRFVEDTNVIRQSRDEYVVDRADKEIVAGSTSFYEKLFNSSVNDTVNYLQAKNKIKSIERLLDDKQKAVEQLQLAKETGKGDLVNLQNQMDGLRAEITSIYFDLDRRNDALYLDNLKTDKVQLIENFLFNDMGNDWEQQVLNGVMPQPKPKTIDSINQMARKFIDDYRKDGRTGLSEVISSIYSDEYNQQFQTGQGFTTVAVHGTSNIDLMVSREFKREKLGTRHQIFSSENGVFFAGQETTSKAYTDLGSPLGTKLQDSLSANSKDYVGIRSEFLDKLKMTVDSLLNVLYSDGFSPSYKEYLEYRKKIIYWNEVEPSLADYEKVKYDYRIMGDKVHTRGDIRNYIEDLVKFNLTVKGEQDLFFGDTLSQQLDKAKDGVVKKQEIIDKLSIALINLSQKQSVATVFENFQLRFEDYDSGANIAANFEDAYKLLHKVAKDAFGESAAGYVLPSPDALNLNSAYYEGLRNSIDANKTRILAETRRVPMELRALVKMKNPLVVEGRKNYDEYHLKDVMEPAMKAGHDGVVFRNMRDGGAYDNIYVVFKDYMDANIMTIDTSFDDVKMPRGNDSEGKPVRYGRELGLRNQPTEGNTGGRVYDPNSKEFKSGFIGLWASKNPDKLKGKNIEFFQKEDGSYRIRMQDNSSGQTKNVGHITASISDTTATLSSNIDPEFRGNKLSYALYSEMAERLRAMGVEMVDGQIVNKDGVPIKVREQVIGDTRDYFSGKPISQDEGAKRIQERQEQVGSMGGVDVYNRLDKQGRYQPVEGRVESIHEDNFNIDSSKAESEALKIAKDSGINILRGKTLSQVYVDKTDVVRGGLWTEVDGNKFSFDVAVDKDSRKKGIGSMLVKSALSEFNSLNEDGSLVLDVDVTSNEMKMLLEKNGFVVKGKENGHTFMTKARYQPVEIPKQKGTSEIKKGYTRVYHQTALENIESIRKNGLLVSKSRPTSESRGVSVSETPFYGNNPNLATIELQVPTEKLRQANGSALLNDVSASDILAVHESWHDRARYIEKNPETLKEVLNGDMDFMLGDGSSEAKAIEYIKNKHSKDKPRYQPAEGEKAPVNWVKEGFNKEGYNSEIIWMTPSRFLKLASPMESIAKGSPSRATIEEIKQTLQRKGSDMDMPVFSMKRNKNGELAVAGHEGRHRAVAIQELYGDKKIPVYLTMDEIMKLQNRGDFDWDVPESERKKGTVSKEFKALEEKPFLNQEGTAKFQPKEGTNATVNKANRSSILKSIQSNAKSVAALKEGQKKPNERTRNYITIDNVNPDLLRDEAVVMHSPDNAGIEPVQIGRFTVQQKGGMRYPIEEFTEGWAANKEGLAKDINDLGDDNKKRGKGWWAPLALIKGIPEKNRGTHTGFEIFLRNIQTLVDNGVLSEESAKNVIGAGFSDADKTLPLDTMADNLLKLSTSNEGKYSITARREAIDVIVPQNLWKELGKAQGIKKLEPHIKGFNSEGITTGADFSTEFLRKMYEASEDPITKHAKVGEVYAYVIFRSKTVEPLSDKHPSYRRSIAPEQGGQPVQLDILSTPMPARQAFKKKIVQGLDISLEGATDSSFKGSTGQANQPTARGRFQPSEGFSTFKSERTPTGVLLKNAAGYVISRVGSKYRVYNPYKAVIGVYDNEEQAKNRIYKEEPRR
jgi:GNAT superfamily N-acetyltransferase